MRIIRHTQTDFFLKVLNIKTSKTNCTNLKSAGAHIQTHNLNPKNINPAASKPDKFNFETISVLQV